MKLLVFGSSDSSGLLLRDPATAWPRILQRELPATGDPPLELAHADLYAGANAAPYAGRQLDRHHPDFVIVAVSAHGFAVSSSAERVQRRFGQRTAAAYRVAGRLYDRGASRAAGPGRAASKLAHRAARRLLGTAALSSYDAVLDSYSRVIRELARHEDVQSVILGGTWLAEGVWRETPGIERQIERFNLALREATLAQRLAWADCESAMTGPGDREACYLDLLHKNELGHRRIADLLAGILAPMVRGG